MKPEHVDCLLVAGCSINIKALPLYVSEWDPDPDLFLKVATSGFNLK